MENRGAQRQPRFRSALFDSMDRFVTRAKKCDPLRLLGMQRAWESADAELFRDLPAGFRRRVKHRDAPSDLSAQSLLSLHAQGAAASGKCTKAAGVAPRFTSAATGD